VGADEKNDVRRFSKKWSHACAGACDVCRNEKWLRPPDVHPPKWAPWPLGQGPLPAAAPARYSDAATLPAPRAPDFVSDPDSTSRKPVSDPLWYQDAVFYELHVKAFQDSNGDAIGDSSSAYVADIRPKRTTAADVTAAAAAYSRVGSGEQPRPTCHLSSAPPGVRARTVETRPPSRKSGPAEDEPTEGEPCVQGAAFTTLHGAPETVSGFLHPGEVVTPFVHTGCPCANGERPVELGAPVGMAFVNICFKRHLQSPFRFRFKRVGCARARSRSGVQRFPAWAEPQ
jgi:hypothetical protein